MRNMEEWCDDHGYVRIHCKKHGNSWSDGGICEACYDDGNMCAGCDDVRVLQEGDLCRACKRIAQEDARKADPKDGRP